MVTQWSEEHTGRLPEEFQRLNDNDYMQRRNIRKAEPIEGQEDTDPGYVCESRIITKQMYEDFMHQMDSPSQQRIMTNFESVAQNQHISDENMLVIMSAIADLYEQIAAISKPSS